MNRGQIKRDAIKHYKRMINCAKTFNGRFDRLTIYGYIREEIDEVWNMRDCSYCKEYFSEETGCGKCPLGREATTFYEIGYTCCEGLHHKIDKSETIEDFIKNLKNVLTYIRKKG